MTEYEVVDAYPALLGESPAWDNENGRLLWVDLHDGVCRSWSPLTARNQWQVPEALTAVVLRSNGDLVGADQEGLFLADDESPGERLIALTPAPTHRMNDAKCDPSGRLWVGSTAIDLEPGQGALHRVTGGLDGVESTTPMSGFTLPNGIGWSPDATVMYLVDSVTRALHRFRFDLDAGEIIETMTTIDVSDVPGLPDGMAVDADGCLWIGQWDGGMLQRRSPSGDLLDTYPLPVQRVTSCCFGGHDLGELYVTTARTDGEDEPLAGHLFRIDVGVAGVPVAPYGW